MNTHTVLQLQASLATITELQIHTEDPDKYQVYENNKAKLLAQLKLVQHNTQAPFRNGNGNSLQKQGEGISTELATGPGSQSVVGVKDPLGPSGSLRDPRQAARARWGL